MALQSFYIQSQILSGLYTAGGQWQLADGTEYVGPYHQYINDKLTYSQSRFLKGVSKQLFPLITDPNINEYNKASKQVGKIWATPIYYFPTVTEQHITQGWMPRYIVQVRNNPNNTIIEINEVQFNNIGTPVTGLDDSRYKSIEIRWRITGTAMEIANSNRQMLVIKNQDFPGLTNYFTNLVEFSGFAPIRQKI